MINRQGEDTGCDGVHKGLREPEATTPQLLRTLKLSVAKDAKNRA